MFTIMKTTEFFILYHIIELIEIRNRKNLHIILN